jgi:hypothetical protein
MSRPLDGLHVVECASFVAGPTGGMTLAQLGADVVRVDPVGGGSDYRRWPVAGNGTGGAEAESYYWASLNKGKRSTCGPLRDANCSPPSSPRRGRTAACSSTTWSDGGGWPTMCSPPGGPT